MSTEILQMAVDNNSQDTANPLVRFGGTHGARMMKVDIPLVYKDGRIPVPFRSGGYDQRAPTDGLVGEPRTCKVSFDHLFDPDIVAEQDYSHIYDTYAAAFRGGAVVGLIFRTTAGAQRIRSARLIEMPWTSDESTAFEAKMQMTFAVDFYSRDLYAPGAAIWGVATYGGGARYGVTGIALPLTSTLLNGTYVAGTSVFSVVSAAGMIAGTTITIDTGALAENLTIQSIAGNIITTTTGMLRGHLNGVVAGTNQITFVTTSSAAVNAGQISIFGPAVGPIIVTLYYGANNSQFTSFTINDTLIVNGSGYIDYYSVDAAGQTLIKDGIETFDMGRFTLPPGQNDWFLIPPGPVTMVVTTGGGYGASSAVYLNFTSFYY